MSATATPWIDDFLPLLQCPRTQQPLRHATDLEKSRAVIAPAADALANEAGTHVYPFTDGILRVLPDDAICL
jgi:uncharacterized protein YbaR (Trm112 family)